MINTMLVAGTFKAFEEILAANDIPFVLDEDEAREQYEAIWEKFGKKDLYLRQARPAVKRIVDREPYLFKKDGEPLRIHFNNHNRALTRDTFGEIFFERADIDWRFSISLKKDANVLPMLPVADRVKAYYKDSDINAFNAVEDFGQKVFGVPCSNQYYSDVNDILLRMSQYDKENWATLPEDDDYLYDTLITPILGAISAEIPRICKNHPDAPKHLLDYFYGNIDYYYLNPIEEVKVTRIGAINSHGGLGRIPGSPNHFTPVVKLPTQLLDVRFARGKYGELSKDTIQVSFDGGWAVCLTVLIVKKPSGRDFEINVHLPVTPYGSYRDQVKWDPEN